jgi:hypothetical protein
MREKQVYSGERKRKNEKKKLEKTLKNNRKKNGENNVRDKT